MRTLVLLSILRLFLLASTVLADDSAIAVLTDANFEHDTQATTGSTTGRWLIFFHDARNRDEVTKLLTDPQEKPVMVEAAVAEEGGEDLAVETKMESGPSIVEELLEAGVVVGTMDISTNPKTVQRLKIPYVIRNAPISFYYVQAKKITSYNEVATELVGF